ncbi:cyclic nucleotide-binding domain-containing protein 2-like isoform X1 [Mytilus californianus]|uniref:cyclic nucleotide-binding domain-containing protein 2-like isoform X1 n=1 Tax=Mytilus californianus TaxID=6549 RepID=UPI002246285A|nr:cyclic nucleotide-binding domain-containing protein 2-like isoform X1 [Mytilus californianus]
MKFEGLSTFRTSFPPFRKQLPLEPINSDSSKLKENGRTIYNSVRMVRFRSDGMLFPKPIVFHNLSSFLPDIRLEYHESANISLFEQYRQSGIVALLINGEIVIRKRRHWKTKLKASKYFYDPINRKISTPESLIDETETAPKIVIQPLVRFRRAVKNVQTLLKATVINNGQNSRNEGKLFSWAQDFMSTRREFEMHGLSFDPADYKARREACLSNEAKTVLSMDPDERTEDQLKIALLALNQAVNAFSEFPITMQRSLVRVGWYEHFEDKRVIIRQGHMADNFYLIISGTAIVTIMDTEQSVRTAAVLTKGNSFGELALMHGSKRTATVTCKNSVELLAVGRDDFIDIFMPINKDQEPEHIRFLRSINILHGWPIECLPHHDPKICCFTFFRRGVLLCKDSNNSEWVYIIKTGNCRVLKSLQPTRPTIPISEHDIKNSHDIIKLPPLISPRSTSSCNTSLSIQSSPSHTSVSSASRKKKRRRCTVDSLINILHSTSDSPHLNLEDHKKEVEVLYDKLHNNFDRRGKRYSKVFEKLEKKIDKENITAEKLFVQIQNLGPRDVFGLEQVAFGMIGNTTSTILVSDGAECILINKKYFQQHLNDEGAKRLRRTLQPLPSEESLQQKLQDKTNWEAYKALTVIDQILYKRQIQNTDSLFY